jgi:hypothetical protein
MAILIRSGGGTPTGGSAYAGGRIRDAERHGRGVKASALPGLGALVAAGTGGAGLYYESMPVVLAAILGSVAIIVTWLRRSAPHDHWRDFRRRHPSDH